MNNGGVRFGLAVALTLIAGCPGPAGPAGAPGANGTNGTNGVQGAAGPMGAMGSMGAMGAMGSMGSPGATGTMGSPGLQGPPGSGVIWKDKTGAQISVLTVINPFDVLLFDPNGLVWQYLPPGPAPAAFVTAQLYTSSDCTGPEYIPAPIGRFTFTIQNHPPTEIYAMPDNLVPEVVVANSFKTSAGGCVFGAQPAQPLVLATDTLPATALTPPTASIVWPVHPEHQP